MARRGRKLEARVAMNASGHLTRNAGPPWGIQFLANLQRIVPRWLLQPMLMAGTWVAVARMPVQRRHSRDFLTLVRGRPAGLIGVWRHFFSFVELLMLRLRIAQRGSGRCVLAPEQAEDFEALIASNEPAFFGTFHFGHSDLLGFLLGAKGRRVSMIRLRLANSADLDEFARQFGHAVSFIWVNERANLLFALKSAVEAGDSLAMQCDRPEFSSRTEAFAFLGARRVFPFTIYHLALLFGRPVIFCIGLPDDSGGTRVIASPLYRPDAPAPDRDLSRARAHFQAVLTRLEELVREQPHLWFNFQPLNPVAAVDGLPREPNWVGAGPSDRLGEHSTLNIQHSTFKEGPGT
jgi:predicted LPLAT superfamily acyltransferase